MTRRRLKQATHRLEDMQTQETSLVDAAANGRRFLFRKSATPERSIDLGALLSGQHPVPSLAMAQPTTKRETSSTAILAKVADSWRAFARMAASYDVDASHLAAVAEEVDRALAASNLAASDRRVLLRVLANASGALIPAMRAIETDVGRREKSPSTTEVIGDAIGDSLEKLTGILQSLRSAPTTKATTMTTQSDPLASHLDLSETAKASQPEPLPDGAWPSDLAETVQKSVSLNRITKNDARTLVRALAAGKASVDRIRSEIVDLRSGDFSAATLAVAALRDELVALAVEDFATAESLARKLGLEPLGGRTEGWMSVPAVHANDGGDGEAE